MSHYFRALADAKRLLIVRYLANHDQVTVTQLGDELRFSQPLMSWHLRRLRRAGIVKTRRSGREVWCSLNRPALQRRVDEIIGLGGDTDENAQDHESLVTSL
ncbi:MAG: helix-turn-helix transcriptional regulator [Chloroflexi bacterium]|nr:helix-turn-helix transcriptional regulator [Chloroflexota bacterium]